MNSEKVTVAVIGSGGREHALVEAYARSPHVGKILVFPGNDFMGEHSHIPIISYQSLTTRSVPEIVAECIKQNVVLVDVAQDDAVEAGLTNALQAAKPEIAVVGPTREAGQIEWDKNWSRELMQRAGVLQPAFKSFITTAEGKQYVEEFFAAHPDRKLFIKTAGLAAGKGAIPGENKNDALKAIEDLQKYGPEYIVEEWIEGDDHKPGEEFSAFAYCDGTVDDATGLPNMQIVGYAQDHKRAFDGDKGDNTGGMGCVSNPMIVTDNIKAQTQANFERIFAQMHQEGRPYKGILYFGGMVVQRNGQPTVYAVECNARWGDPEAQVLVPGIQNDFFELNMAVAQGRLNTIRIQTDGLTRVSIAAAAEGYPGSVVKDTDILGLEDIDDEDVTIFGAGIRRGTTGWKAHGGRLFHIVGKGLDVLDARAKAYAAMDKLQFRGFFRRDIGWRDVQRIKEQELVMAAQNSPV